MFMPMETTGLERAFPTDVSRLLPCKYEEIPREFTMGGQNTWAKFQATWFFHGIKGLSVEPKEGIDAAKALKHLACIQGTYELKHEHKTAFVAYLASLWFDSWKGE